MRIIFFGLGSIGLRHAALLQGDKTHELYAFRTYKGQKQNTLGIRELSDWDQVADVNPQVAFITNPTALHVQTALQCAKRGMHLFIEKPLDSSLRNLPTLLQIVSRRKLSTYVAYLLRFHPIVQAFKKCVERQKPWHTRVVTTSCLHRWRPGVDTKKSYSSRRELGGGAIWDLSHELDYIQYVLGDIQDITGRFSRNADITVDTEDNADILLETKSCPVNVHLNFLSQREQRVIQMDFKDYSLEGDFRQNTLTEFRKGRHFKTRQFSTTVNDCYDLQLNFFLKNIHNQRMMNNIFEAAGLLRKIYSFKRRD